MPGKLGRTTKQRLAILRSQASQLLWYGKIETTAPRAKELRSYVEKLITKAVNSYDDVVEYEVVAKDKKGKEIKSTAVKDGPKKLAAPSTRSLPSTHSARKRSVRAAVTPASTCSVSAAAMVRKSQSSNSYKEKAHATA